MARCDTLRTFGYFWGRLALAGLGVLVMGTAIWACSTPVYRYAMYRWEPAPYEVYYFHDDAIGDSAKAFHDSIRNAAKSEEKPINLFLATVDVKADSELKTVPPDVRKWWLAQEEKKTGYVLVTPYGVPIHHGDLDEDVFQAMIDSPARQALVAKLAEGHAGVMLLLSGSDKKANAEAEKAIEEFVADIASGKIELYMPPPQGFFGPPGAGGETEQPEPPKVQVGMVKVERSDAKEKWLVESLLSMEEDLKNEEFVDKPMMFMVFGRGRALPPCVGKGVNRDNLLDCVDFVTGACSCTVKDQNPGMDLLFATDWYQVAEKIAAKFGAEEGNEYQLATEDFFPDLAIPGTSAVAAAGPEEGEMAAGADEPAEPSTPEQPPAETAAETAPAVESADSADSPAAPASADQPAAGHATDADDHGVPDVAAPLEVAPEAASDSSPEAVATGIFGGVFVVGAGLAVAFLLLFGMTFVVLRPR